MYVMLTLPLLLTSESFLGWGGGEQINTSKPLEILCQLQLFDISKDLQTLVTFFGKAKNSSVFHFCACFHAWVADHVITFYDRVFALSFRVASLPSPCLPGLLGQFI